MAEYGIPYMGSKDKICDSIIKLFPKADNFYDLFGGGFSITHAMLLRRPNDYKEFHFNEIRPGICDLIKSAIAGNFNYKTFKPPFVSREEFLKTKDTNPYIKMIWSFGNNGRNYLFSKEIEPYKKSMHNAIVFNEFDDLAKKVLGMEEFKKGYSINERRLFLRNRIKFFRKTKMPDFLKSYLSEKQLQQLQQLLRLEQLLRLKRLEQLQQLEKLEKLERLSFYSQSYEKIKIKDGSVIYCDPPYADTALYDKDFDHKSFFDWADKQNSPVFISEYDIPDKRFSLVFKIKKASLFSSNSREIKMEKIYVNRAGLDSIRKLSPGRKAELISQTENESDKV